MAALKFVSETLVTNKAKPGHFEHFELRKEKDTKPTVAVLRSSQIEAKKTPVLLKFNILSS